MSPWKAARIALVVLSPKACAQRNSESATLPLLVAIRTGRELYHHLSVTSYPIAWDATFVYRSHDPVSFADAPIGRARAHAAEWLFDPRGQAYATHAGPGQRGTWISRFELPDIR